jgi:hypothetical protein
MSVRIFDYHKWAELLRDPILENIGRIAQETSNLDQVGNAARKASATNNASKKFWRNVASS